MNIAKLELSRGAGSCNSCNRGTLDKLNFGQLIFPYKEVYEIDAEGVRLRFCKECLIKLKKIIDNTFSTKGESQGGKE